MMNFIKKNWMLLVIILSSILLFSPGMFKFFFGDDWFHLNIIQISSVREFLNFFNPIPNEQSTAFYRPIPNQLFFYTFYTIFGLSSFYYHLLIYILFAISLYLFYLFLTNLQLPKKAVLLSVLIIAFSHTNFTRLYFLSAGQEIMMSFFVLLGLLSNQKKQTFKQNSITAVFYALALLCKDSALIFPGLILIFDWLKDKKIHYKKLIILSLVALLYLFVRVFLFGFSVTLDGHESYTPSFSPKVLLNTFYMYSVWAVGGAELLQDYLRSPISLIERYVLDFGFLGKLMIASLILTASAIGVIFIKNSKKINQLQVTGLLIFCIGLLPVLFFPHHKFTIQMSVPMYGFALFLGVLFKNESKKILYLFIALYLTLNIASIQMTKNTHYSVQRATISESVYNYVQRELNIVQDTTVVFLNSNTAGSAISTWGSSQQISHALMGRNFFEVLYPHLNVTVLYEDLEENIILDQPNTLYLPSDLFIQ